MNKTFQITVGLSSIISLSLTIVFTYYALTNKQFADFKEIIALLSVTVMALLISTIFLFVYYFKQVDKLKEMPYQVYKMRIESRNKDIKIQNSASYFHTISHYYRNLIYEFENYLSRYGELKKDDVDELLIHFDKFLNTFTSNLQSFMTLYTNDSCAVTIKIVNYSPSKEKLVKTFYRDPIHYRKRKKSDKGIDNSDVIHNVNDNTAFKIIASPKYKDTTFLCDDLKSLWESGVYENRTQGWMQLYNACAIVPINKRLPDNERNIVGFLCVDNFSGNLANSPAENYLCAVADMLYNVFVQFEKIVILANKLGVNNVRAKAYANWDFG